MRRPLALALAGILALGGCGAQDDERGAVVDWDLSAGHAVQDAGLDAEGLGDAPAEVRPEDVVVTELPGGRTFDSGGRDVDRIGLEHDGAELTTVRVVSRPTSLQAGRSRAGRRAEQVGLPADDIDEWVRQAQRAGDRPIDGAAIGGGRLGVMLGDGPRPTIELTHRPGTEAPMGIALRLVWR